MDFHLTPKRCVGNIRTYVLFADLFQIQQYVNSSPAADQPVFDIKLLDFYCLI